MSYGVRNLKCFNCKSWLPSAEGADHEPSHERSIFGQCRRYAPPTLLVDLPDHGRRYPAWATTKRDDWCGEHQHMEM